MKATLPRSLGESEADRRRQFLLPQHRILNRQLRHHHNRLLLLLLLRFLTRSTDGHMRPFVLNATKEIKKVIASVLDNQRMRKQKSVRYTKNSIQFHGRPLNTSCDHRHLLHGHHPRHICLRRSSTACIPQECQEQDNAPFFVYP
ncbi:hypothetical protein SAY87_025852 [Trapa incisa]|uniref:Uncharacterized protein n=1 Tax=Trapa incisa TaxID=236973 RepID=A0AAN7JKA3_9MYRT|nr:hypothetical protein SAY87_025852 [Trapa incisa]